MSTNEPDTTDDSLQTVRIATKLNVNGDSFPTAGLVEFEENIEVHDSNDFVRKTALNRALELMDGGNYKPAVVRCETADGNDSDAMLVFVPENAERTAIAVAPAIKNPTELPDIQIGDTSEEDGEL